MINVRIFQADEGDAFLISFGENKETNILIDCGTTETYINSIKPVLELLKEQGKLLDLLVITHTDNDHILGAIPLIEENGYDNKIIEIKEIWHNSYRHLQFKEKKKIGLPDKEKSALQELKIQNQTINKSDGTSNIGYKEGTSLASLIFKYGYNWNDSFSEKAVCSEIGSICLNSDLRIILLSPNQTKLTKLSNKWLKKLNSIIYNFKLTDDIIFDDAFEFYFQNLEDEVFGIKDTSINSPIVDLEKLSEIEEKDYSITNGSSISFILQYQGKNLLFLGDAHEDIIFESISELKAKGFSCFFDLVKISHHGSNKNISKRLLSLFEAKKYLISTNGLKFNHPDIEAISKIIVQNSTIEKEIIFNYKHDKLNFLDDLTLKEKYKFQIFVSDNISI